jgi:DtxR family transcriptional regulator, Mn-dependent transcriptional regulator
MRKRTIEDYVELVYDVQKGKKRVHTNDIASALNVNPASVTEIFQKLSAEGYVSYKKYSGIKLTDKGLKIALKTKKKHTTLKEFLTLLGVDDQIAEKDACEMEHILHPITMKTIIKFVEVVNKCKGTPFWLERLKDYVKTGELSKCPNELFELCKNYQKIKN